MVHQTLGLHCCWQKQAIVYTDKCCKAFITVCLTASVTCTRILSNVPSALILSKTSLLSNARLSDMSSSRSVTLSGWRAQASYWHTCMSHSTAIPGNRERSDSSRLCTSSAWNCNLKTLLELVKMKRCCMLRKGECCAACRNVRLMRNIAATLLPVEHPIGENTRRHQSVDPILISLSALS